MVAVGDQFALEVLPLIISCIIQITQTVAFGPIVYYVVQCHEFTVCHHSSVHVACLFSLYVDIVNYVVLVNRGSQFAMCVTVPVMLEALFYTEYTYRSLIV